MAWKMYKDYRNGKHNKQQYRPPSGSPSMLGGMGGMSSLLSGSGGPTMYPSGGGGRPEYGAGQGRFGNEHGHGHQQYGTHGRPDDRMVSCHT